MNGEGARASITIDAPIDVVWSVFTDVERWPTWASSFTSVELIDGPMRLGAKARIRQPRLPTVVWEVTKWEPGRSWTWAATGPGARTEASHVLTAAGGRTVAEQAIVSSVLNGMGKVHCLRLSGTEAYRRAFRKKRMLRSR